MDAQSKEFFTIWGRISYALHRSLPYFMIISVCYLMGATQRVFASGGKEVLDSTVYFFLPVALCVTIFLFHPAHSRLQYRIKRIPKNIEPMDSWEKEQLKTLCNRLVRRLNEYKEEWSKDTYQKAINDMVYPYLAFVLATTDNRTTYENARRHINNVLTSLADYETTSTDPDREAQKMSSAEFTKHLDNALVLMRFINIEDKQTSKRVGEVKSCLQAIKDNPEVGMYLQHNPHLSRVLSVYIDHLHHNYASYHNVRSILKGGFENAQEYKTIEEHVMKNLDLIHSNVKAALQDYIQYEHGKVLASASVLSEFAGVEKSKLPHSHCGCNIDMG